MSDKVDIADVIDGQKFRLFNANLLFWTFLVCMVDGYDFTAPGYVAPALVKAWSLNPSQLAPIFSAAIVGILCGAPLLGYVGDRFGRKKALVCGTLLFALLTFASALAESLWQLVALRFLTGMALGGVMSIAIVLSSEFAPKRLRGTLTCIMFSGLTVGAGLPGVVAGWIVPQWGWEAVFVIGGIIPIVLTVAMAFTIPESIKFLTLRPERRTKLVKLLKIIDPALQVGPNTQFVIADEKQASKVSLRDLFRGRLSVITPLLWVMLAMIGIVVYFVQIWTPILLTQIGISASQAALSATSFQVGGMIGVILMGITFDRWGLKPILFSSILAIPVIICVGTPGLSEFALAALLFVAGYLVLGTLNGVNVLSAVAYPTYMRGNGVGWAFGIGRVGFLLGAQVGSLRAFFKVSELFYLTAAPLAIASLACIALGWYRGYSASGDSGALPVGLERSQAGAG
jgi:AAHS family 4-hydroxybenzoate transporter-like MFS transporter